MKTHPQKGWPVDGAAGEWLGWDSSGRLSLLRWCTHLNFNEGRGAWVGVRFDPRNMMPGRADTDELGAPLNLNQWPLCFVRSVATESFVVMHRPAIGARGE